MDETPSAAENPLEGYALAADMLSRMKDAEPRHSGQAVECPECDGKGWYAWGETDKPEQRQCEACHGTGQAVDRQGEAYEKLQIKCQGCGVSWFIEVPSETWWSLALAEANELMNRELSAERQRAEKAERSADESRQAVIDAMSLSNEVDARLRQQFLSALAAIKEALQQLSTMNDFVPSRLVAVTLRHVDLSLLHQHDAEVSKPLVEALGADDHELALYENNLTSVATELESKKVAVLGLWTVIHSVRRWRKRLSDALAKVKEGP